MNGYEAHLEPCPFCKRDDVDITYSFSTGSGGHSMKYHGWCNDCRIAGPEADTPEEAESKWNSWRDQKR